MWWSFNFIFNYWVLELLIFDSSFRTFILVGKFNCTFICPIHNNLPFEENKVLSKILNSDRAWGTVCPECYLRSACTLCVLIHNTVLGYVLHFLHRDLLDEWFDACVMCNLILLHSFYKKRKFILKNLWINENLITVY